MINRTGIRALGLCFAPNTGGGTGGSGSGDGGAGGAGAAGAGGNNGGEGGNGAGAGAGGNGSGGAGGSGGTNGGSGAGGAAPNWDEWHGSLTDHHKGLIDTHVSGLKTALQSERDSKRDLETQLRDLAAKAEKGSETEKQLTETADKLKNQEKQSTFYEAAHAAGVKNLKLAWITAQADDLFKRDGTPDLDELKKNYPELFASTNTNANAGNGAGQGAQNNGQTDMNAEIRRAAGRA